MLLLKTHFLLQFFLIFTPVMGLLSIKHNTAGQCLKFLTFLFLVLQINLLRYILFGQEFVGGTVRYFVSPASLKVTQTSKRSCLFFLQPNPQIQRRRDAQQKLPPSPLLHLVLERLRTPQLQQKLMGQRQRPAENQTLQVLLYLWNAPQRLLASLGS